MGLLLAYFYEADQDASRYARYGVLGLRHRGHRVTYVSLSSDGVKVLGLDPWSGSLEGLPGGWASAAAVEPSARLYTAKSGAVRAVALVDGGCPGDRLAEAAARGGVEEAAMHIAGEDYMAPCAAIVLRSDGGYALGRGRESRRPLSLGGYGFEALLAATETAPITLMGGRSSHDIDAGEALYGDRYTMNRVRLGGKRRTSLFEYVYMARSDSLVDGVNVYLFRRTMGARLARVHQAEVDVVVGVPETALPYALGYAAEKGLPLELGFVSTLGRIRTAVAGLGHEERLRALSLKLNPVPGVFEAKRVAVVDDSVVTGFTLKTVVQRLRRLHGALEVHVAVSSPRIRGVCPYRLQVLDPASLVARHLSDEEIMRVLDVDSLAWLPLGEAVSYLEDHGIEPCTACMG